MDVLFKCLGWREPLNLVVGWTKMLFGILAKRYKPFGIDAGLHSLLTIKLSNELVSAGGVVTEVLCILSDYAKVPKIFLSKSFNIDLVARDSVRVHRHLAVVLSERESGRDGRREREAVDVAAFILFLGQIMSN